MMFFQVIFTIVAKCLSSRNTEVSFILITNFLQGRNSIFQSVVILNNYIYINNRFCRQPLHGSTPHVFDANCQLPKSIRKFILYFKKIQSPMFIEWFDNNMFRNHFTLPRWPSSCCVQYTTPNPIVKEDMYAALYGIPVEDILDDYTLFLRRGGGDFPRRYRETKGWNRQQLADHAKVSLFLFYLRCILLLPGGSQIFQQRPAHHRAGSFGKRQPQCPAAGRLQRAGHYPGAAKCLHHQLL